MLHSLAQLRVSDRTGTAPCQPDDQQCRAEGHDSEDEWRRISEDRQVHKEDQDDATDDQGLPSRTETADDHGPKQIL